MEIARNTFPTLEQVLETPLDVPNTLHFALDKVYDNISNFPTLPVIHLTQRDFLTAMVKEINDRIEKKNYTFDPCVGEIILNLSCVGANGFFGEIEGATVHQLMRDHLEKDGWENVIFRPATGSHGEVTIRLGNKKLRHVAATYVPLGNTHAAA